MSGSTLIHHGLDEKIDTTCMYRLLIFVLCAPVFMLDRLQALACYDCDIGLLIKSLIYNKAVFTKSGTISFTRTMIFP